MPTFDTSVMLDTELRLNELFGVQKDTPKVVGGNELLKAIVSRQTVRLTDEFAGNDCRKVKAFYMYDCTTSGACDVDFTTEGCDLSDGSAPEVDEIILEDNIRCREVRTVQDFACKNQFELAELTALAMKSAIQKLRQQLCEKVAADLVANAAPNTYTGTEGTVAGTTTAYNISDEALANMTLDWTNTCGDSQLDPVIITGKNFYKDVFKAGFDNCCDSLSGLYAAYPMTFDFKLDTVAGTPSTLFVDPSRTAFWTRGLYSAEPTVIDTAKNIWAWTMDDPEITYARDGVQVPVQYNVIYQKVCTGRNQNGVLQYKHTYEITIIGGSAVSPTACNNCSGIMHFISV